MAGHLDALEQARRPLRRVLVAGEVIEVRSPAELPLGEVMAALESAATFELLVVIPHWSDEAETWTWPQIPAWQMDRLHAEWIARYDVGTLESARRLLYLVDRYREDIEYDLHVRARLDLGELWRARRWRQLLAAIDRLPRDTHYAEVVSQDEEHMKMIVEAQAGQPKGSSAPRLSAYSPEVEALHLVADLIQAGNIQRIALNSRKGIPKFRPAERPESVYARLQQEQRQVAHQTLADRVLRRGAFAPPS